LSSITRITSSVLARSIYLCFGSLDVNLSDNFVNILPGETADIKVATIASLDELKSRMKVVSLPDAFAPPLSTSIGAH
jgi:beta-mannosidase